MPNLLDNTVLKLEEKQKQQNTTTTTTASLTEKLTTSLVLFFFFFLISSQAISNKSKQEFLCLSIYTIKIIKKKKKQHRFEYPTDIICFIQKMLFKDKIIRIVFSYYKHFLILIIRNINLKRSFLYEFELFILLFLLLFAFKLLIFKYNFFMVVFVYLSVLIY